MILETLARLRHIAATFSRGQPRRRLMDWRAGEIQCLEGRLYLSAQNGGRAVAETAESTIAVTQLAPLSVETSTGEKPQSKVWTAAGAWWAVFSDADGMGLWKLSNGAWQRQQTLCRVVAGQADVKSVGNIVHVLVKCDSGLQLVSLQYDSAAGAYVPWSVRSANVSIPAPSHLETATFDIDSKGRMWVAYTYAKSVFVRYSDGPYSTWSPTVTLATELHEDDIAAVIALPGKIAVFWSNQSKGTFGFRTHKDGANPTSWTSNESPGSQSAPDPIHKFADDHIKLVVAPNGTLYAAAKTGYDQSGKPGLILLIRRPNGKWASIVKVDAQGTRPSLALDSETGQLIYAYRNTDGAGPIMYRVIRDTGKTVSVGAESVLIGGGGGDNDENNVSTVGSVFQGQVVFIAAGSTTLETAVVNIGASTSLQASLVGDDRGRRIRASGSRPRISPR